MESTSVGRLMEVMTKLDDCMEPGPFINGTGAQGMANLNYG